MYRHRTLIDTSRICSTCLRRILHAQRSFPSRSAHTLAFSSSSRSRFSKNYFLGNDLAATTLSKGRDKTAFVPTNLKQPRSLSAIADGGETLKEYHPDNGQSNNAPALEQALPHRRRKRRKAQEDNETSSNAEQPLPLDASSQLSTIAARLPLNTLRQRFFAYLSLSKPRLTFLIVLTTTASYSLFPVAVSPFASSVDLSPWSLLALTTGTALASASANALNMWYEPAYDAQMSRTRSRPLVRGLITSRAALAFAAGTGLVGVLTLYYGANPTTAFLGAANIVIYAGIYTPLKRLSVLNTWAGAVVGGIPPLMGWSAAAAQATPYADATWRDLLFAADGSSAGGWLLAALLFAWQFPHFWALAYPIRSEYAAAGYRMLVSYNVRQTARISLRYSLLMFPICIGLSSVGVTNWAFIPSSGIANAWLVRESWRYLRHEGAKSSARGLFWASVWHLPVVLVLAMVMKKGLWERFVQGGLDEEELEAWRYLDSDEVPAKRAESIRLQI